MGAIHITKSYRLTILFFLAILHLARPQDSETVTTIDDRNPAIKYSAGWARIPGSSDFNNTLTLSRVAGSTATYKFNGTQVSVFGTQGTDGNTTISTYSIDNSFPSQYTVPLGLNTIQNRILFYSSPPLTDGEHTLVIRNLKDRGWYWLDYIQVTSPTSTSTPTSTPGNKNKNEAGISKGAIAGIALGASALIVLLLLAAFLWRRRYLKSTEGDSTADHIQPLEQPMRRGTGARLEPYQVGHFVSNIPTSSNGLNDKRTYNGVAHIRSTENNVDASDSPVDGHASDNATAQYTSEGREDTSEIPHSEPSMSRPMSLSKLRPPYRGASSSRSTGDPSSAPMPQMPPSVATPSSPPQISSSNRRSTDGGIRIAGGPRTTRGEELDEMADSSTLPPAYGSY